MTQRQCGSCNHFLPENAGQGYCRRYPPVPFPTGPGKVTAFTPPVQVEGTCGEWAVRLEVARDLSELPPIGVQQ